MEDPYKRASSSSWRTSINPPEGIRSSKRPKPVRLHFPGFKGPTEVRRYSQKDRPLSETQLAIRGRLAYEIASPARVRWALKSFNPLKSPGPDGIYLVLLQRAGDPIIGPLVRLARDSLTLGYVPKAWRGTRVIFVPKAGKNGWTSPKDFRPISLTSFVLKKRWRDSWTDISAIRFWLQNCYIRICMPTWAGRSTETALSKTVNLIENQLNLKGFAIGILRVPLTTQPVKW